MIIGKQDYAIGALVGFLAGVFAIPTLLNVGFRDRTILILLPLIVPFLVVFGLWLGKILSRLMQVFTQIAKFASVGILNTAVDFGVLNLLSMATGVTTGIIVGGVNIPGFLLAVVNSYFWNKYWVFQQKDGGAAHDFPKFFAIAVAGLLVNSAVVVGVTSVPPFLPVEDQIWLNFAKAAASTTSLAWNFLGYKFLVFKTPKASLA